MPTPLTSDDIFGILNTLKSGLNTSDITGNLNGSLSSIIKDPIGSSLIKSMTSLNNLSGVIKDKVGSLTDNISNSGATNIKLVGDKLTIVSADTNAKVNEAISLKLKSDISSINSYISKFNTLNSTLSVLNTTVGTLKKAVDIQEALLSINPVSKATLTVFKQALKILFFRDVLGEYSNILNSSIAKNKTTMNVLSSRFKDLQVKVISSDQLSESDAKELNDNALPVNFENFTENYISPSGNEYILKVEGYGTREKIARAYDGFSGQIITQTAPSLSIPPGELINEIKRILN